MVTALVAILITLGLANLIASIASTVVRRPIVPALSPMPTKNTVHACPVTAELVSVHVAVHDEPANLVIATLDALAASNYSNFEVIVVDNNTPARATWQPVSDHVALLGSRFRFYHFDDVKGAKAGALNLALELTDARAHHVAIVDADYQVTPDFIATAVAHCVAGVQFVQFPQDYRFASGAGAVVQELADYFQTFPRAANRDHASLLTGTLSLISINALRGVGGWPTRSITEDAELGLRLWGAGTRGLYVDQKVGAGLLPVDIAGLRLQRRRWVTGNVQTLIGGGLTLVRAQTGVTAVLAQLTAWIGLLAIPLITLAIVATAGAVPWLEAGSPIWVWRLAEGISVASFFSTFLGHVILAICRNRVSSMIVTSALLWTSSFGWLAAFGLRRPKFQRTPKAGFDRNATLSVDTLGCLAALVIAGAFLLEGSPVTAAALMLSAAGLVTAPIIDRSLRQAATGI